mmetsp:Transcript_76015/g.211195  ORF Transcript_76015/g.211195 Transcript_76015/m.211195 type:complete len:210 (-) Transcript_76015:1337-1966(-)
MAFITEAPRDNSTATKETESAMRSLTGEASQTTESTPLCKVTFTQPQTERPPSTTSTSSYVSLSIRPRVAKLCENAKRWHCSTLQALSVVYAARSSGRKSSLVPATSSTSNALDPPLVPTVSSAEAAGDSMRPRFAATPKSSASWPTASAARSGGTRSATVMQFCGASTLSSGYSSRSFVLILPISASSPWTSTTTFALRRLMNSAVWL